MGDTTSDVSVVKMYAAREIIYPREISGRYASVRWFFVWLTQLIFYGLPWLNWVLILFKRRILFIEIIFSSTLIVFIIFLLILIIGILIICCISQQIVSPIFQVTLFRSADRRTV
jgi:polyferredoxin